MPFKLSSSPRHVHANARLLKPRELAAFELANGKQKAFQNEASMSSANILNTKTMNFQEVIGNGKLYSVPPYQRDYSWSEEQWEDLWNDIVEMSRNPEEKHYMGALVAMGKSDRDFLIIDGQQRLATLSVLGLAVIHRLEDLAAQGVDPEANRERGKELRNRFIGEKDPASLVERSRLVLNHADDGFYQDYLVQLRKPLNPRRLPKSNRLLWECFQYFSTQLERLAGALGGGAGLAGIFSETVARQLLFIFITVDTELNAYVVFETLNARGLELTTTDLLKNYLFSRVQAGGDLDTLQRRWRTMIATVGQERFPDFLRYHMLCEEPKIRTQQLFKLVRKRAQNSGEVFVLLEALESRAELFAAIFDPNHTFWIDLPDAKPFIRELNLFHVRQMTPLLFAAWQRFSPDNFVRVLRIVSVISFRFTVVGGLNTNLLEPVYHRAAKAVLDTAAQTPQAVFDQLREIYVDDQKFAQDFTQLLLGTAGQSRKLAKYMLAKLESDAAGVHCDPETDPGTIEHILPENPAGDWADTFDQRAWEADVYRLGNLTLLESPSNREIGNATYPQKVRVYQESRYALTKHLAEFAPETWTRELLEARQRRMGERAKHLWRTDFT